MSGRRVRREAGREWVAYDVMRLKALRKRDEVAGAEAEAEDRRESEAEGVPLTDSRKAPGCCYTIFKSAIASMGRSKTHNVIWIVGFHPAFLWCWYAIVCWPTWSQCPKNIFMDFIWPSSKLSTFEEFLD